MFSSITHWLTTTILFSVCYQCQIIISMHPIHLNLLVLPSFHNTRTIYQYYTSQLSCPTSKLDLYHVTMNSPTRSQISRQRYVTGVYPTCMPTSPEYSKFEYPARLYTSPGYSPRVIFSGIQNLAWKEVNLFHPMGYFLMEYPSLQVYNW